MWGTLGAVATLGAAAIGLWLWYVNRKTREEELLDAIHTDKREVEKALHREDYDALAVANRDLLDDLDILLRKRRAKVPAGK